MTGELRATVGGVVRHSEAGNPVTDEGSRTGLSGGVRQWNGFRPPSEAVDDRKELLHALGLTEGAHQVDMETAKETVRWWSLGERCLNVAVDLRRLHSRHLLRTPSHFKPCHMKREEMVHCVGQGQVVYGIEDPLRPLPRNHWSWFTHRNVAEDCAAVELKAEARNGGFVGGDFL